MSADLSSLVTASDRVALPVADAFAPAAGAPVDGPTLVGACLPLIQQAIAFVCRHQRLTRDEGHDLASDVYVRLLQRDAAVLRQYRGESSLSTFLVVVIQRVLLDARIARSGKWRPSAAARRLGRVAIHLERLVFHEGLTLAEAGALVREHVDATHTDDELHFLLMLLPARHRRRMIGEGELEHLPAAHTCAEHRLERDVDRRSVARALGRLSEADRRIISLRFSRGRRLCEIARGEGLDEKRIYRRFEAAMGRLRAEVRAERTSDCVRAARSSGPRPRPSRPADRS